MCDSVGSESTLASQAIRSAAWNGFLPLDMTAKRSNGTFTRVQARKIGGKTNVSGEGHLDKLSASVKQIYAWSVLRAIRDIPSRAPASHISKCSCWLHRSNIRDAYNSFFVF